MAKLSMGLFTWREEDPRRQNIVSMGFHAKYFGPCGAQVEKDRERIRWAGDKNKNEIGPICSLY